MFIPVVEIFRYNINESFSMPVQSESRGIKYAELTASVNEQI